jgi:dipeptidyl aminopeptidase/acylaminoacyl peptidase
VMLVHPELDGNPMAHAEAYFMALERRGVPARLVRYWGEQHVLTSPANLRDYWERSVAWFDRYLK